MSTDDSICESSLPPNKSSGDIGELRSCPFCGCATPSLNPPVKGIVGFTGSINCPGCMASMPREIDDAELIRSWNTRTPDPETAAEIERLKREVASLQRALLFWMPGVDLRLDEATRERVEGDAGLLAGYTGPTDGPCWGDGMLERALTAESAVAAAMGYLDREIRITSEQSEQARLQGRRQDMFRFNTAFHALTKAASAIRAAVSKKTAESGHSPSTHNSESA